MAEVDPRAKYRVLSESPDVSGAVEEVDVAQSDVEHAGYPDYDEGANAYLRVMGWRGIR